MIWNERYGGVGVGFGIKALGRKSVQFQGFRQNVNRLCSTNQDIYGDHWVIEGVSRASEAPPT